MVCQSKMPVDERAILGEQLVFNCGKTAKNRFMKAALSEAQGTWNPENPKKHGHPTQQLINLYSKWGHGGYGLLLTGNVIIDMNHIEAAGNVIVSKENDSPKLRQLLKEMATACNAEGTLSIAQVGHAGRQTKIAFNKTPYSSSDVQLKVSPFGKFGKPVPLTVEEIQTEVIERFVFAAKVLKEAGFHGIQLHGAHGYLLAQFMSLTTNKRTDQYGGSAENRFRIVKEVYQAIREEIPASTGFVVGLKMNSVEFQEQGLQTDDARIMCDLVEELGFDFVEMSGGTYEKLAFEHTKESTRKREAFFMEFTDYLRSSFKKTKMYVTGGFRSAEGMIRAIESNSCDGIGLGRPATAETDLPKKLLSGETSRALAPALPEEVQTLLMSAAISKTQMWQAGQSAYHNNNHYEGMSDLTNKEIAFAYLAGVTKFLEEAATAGKLDDVKYGIFKFTNDEQN